MKLAGRTEAPARPVIGSVEVLEANTALGAITASTSRVMAALTSRFSNTASMIRSQSRSAAASAAGVMRARVSSACAAVIRLRSTRLASSDPLYALPFCARSSVVSSNTQGTPRFAQAQAMPEPIMPAPRMPTRPTFDFGTPFGRLRPALTSFI